MKKFTLIMTTLAVLGVVNIQAADSAKKSKKRELRETKGDIEKRIQAINKLDNNEAARRVGLAAVSKETAVPLPTIEEQYKAHSKAGVAGGVIGKELGTHTHKKASHLLKAHEEEKRNEI